MAESDCEIEYLDEDEDIVQQCVQVPTAEDNQLIPVSAQLLQPVQRAIDLPKSTPLLVERRSEKGKKKRKRQEEDSDYDPDEDIMAADPPSPPSSPRNKKKKFSTPVVQPKQFKYSEPEEAKTAKKVKLTPPIIYQEMALYRKKCNVRIPDYDDPLCLPVKALNTHESDVRRLENWNNVCLEHFKHCDTMLKSERGDTKSSVRTLVLKNLMNKQTRKLETTIWSKTSVENHEGDKKSEIFQCVLPRYKERRALSKFVLASRKVRPYRMMHAAVLAREDHKDGEALVVYKPKEATAAVYKLFDRNSTNEDAGSQQEEQKSFLKEMVFSKMCVGCFQTSWRGLNKIDQKKTLLCPICGRHYVAVFNLLAHLKTHSTADVRKCKKVIGAALADVVGYHYKCRVCQVKSANIKTLRQHLSVHRGSEKFLCEVGNHYTT